MFKYSTSSHQIEGTSQKGIDIQMGLNGDISFGEQFSLKAEYFADMAVTQLPLSVRVINRFKSNNIFTVADLLSTKPETLMEIKGFGRNSMEEVENSLILLPKAPPIEKNLRQINPGSKLLLVTSHAESIALGDFSFSDGLNLSDEENHILSVYKNGFETIGEDLALECYCNPEKIVPIISMMSSFCDESQRLSQLRSIAETIPFYRRQNRAVGYINAFTIDDFQRKILLSLCPSEACTIEALTNIALPKNPQELNLLKEFLKWCSFDLNSEVEELFRKIYVKERTKTVIQMRARKKTLEQTGSVLGVTRERVRQIEAKARRIFIQYYRQVRIISKIMAEENSSTVLTSADIEEYCKTDIVELLYFLRSYENSHYIYDEQLDLFIIGDDSIQERVRSYVESLPDLINVNRLPTILNDASENDDIPQDVLQKAFMEAYRLTGDVYHRTRLSLGAVYLAVLEKYYPDGIRAYDPDELQNFRMRVVHEFGDVGMPENNRALTARIASVCVLCGKGMYKPKGTKYISSGLANRILQYIEESDQTIFLMNSLYSVFENELNDEGVCNKYYLQGILRELCSDKYYFRRDYLSKDAEATFLYSSVVNFIKKSEYPVQKQQIQNAFPGITEIVIVLSVNDPDVLNYFGSYLHASRLVISDEEKDSLYRILAGIVSDHEAHHGTKVYEFIQRQMPVIFSRNAAMHPFSTFSILEYLFQDYFQFSRPYIAEKGVEIGRPGERLHNLIYSGDEFSISDIKKFCKEHQFQIQSLLEYVNSCNDRFLLRDVYTMVSIERTGITESVAREAENVITQEVSGTQPISQLTCWHHLPKIAVPWTDWLIYSVLNKWGSKLSVATSSNQLRTAVPMVAPRGEINSDAFKDIALDLPSQSAKIDDLDNIDDLIADLIELEEDLL